MAEISLPHNWISRPHQQGLFKAMLPKTYGGEGVKRSVNVWHRRAGKDACSINLSAIWTQYKVATYWHMLPTATQGRKVIWDAIDSTTGVKMIDQAFPKEIRASVNEKDMKIEMKNGSIWQVVGSDNYDGLVGSNPFGVVYSEYSVSDPQAWDYIRPILKQNDGWAVFIYTPRGKNHGSDLYEMARTNPKWQCEILTIEDTLRETGKPVFSQEDFQDELDSGMDLLLAKQEYYCSFDAGLYGSYYTNDLTRTKTGEYPWNPRKDVHTFWDIGMKDATAIWFAQESGDAINIIDYMEGNNIPFTEWVKKLRDLPYSYGENIMPHDFKKRNWNDGRSAPSTASELNFPFEICPDIPRKQGIDAVKDMMPRIRFNNIPMVMRGVDALANYRREYNQKIKMFLDTPAASWANHGADAFRYLAIAWPESYSQMHEAHNIISSNGQTTRALPRAARG